jgi:glycosyltransferase involved in cell wall biosynthesis
MAADAPMLAVVSGGGSRRGGSPRVSVVMAVRDGERFVADAIGSLRNQTLGDFQLIVVDDGSVDETPQIVEALAAQDDRIHLEVRGHAGYPQALNAGWQLADSEYVGVLDADDLAEPGRLERQFGFLERNPDVGVVGGALLLITTAGRPFYIAAYPEAPADARDALKSRSPLGHTCVLMRRAVLEEVGGYRSEFPLAEERHALANLPDIVGRYRIHGGNGSVTGIRRQAASMTAARVEALSPGSGSQKAETDIADSELELALWWAQIAARAGSSWQRVEKDAWRLARTAAPRTSDPAASQARIAQTRAKLEAQTGRSFRAVRRRLSQRLDRARDTLRR